MSGLSQYKDQGYVSFSLCAEIDSATGKSIVWLWGIGKHSDDSVIAGEKKYARLERFNRIADAQRAYPDLDIRIGKPAGVEEDEII